MNKYSFEITTVKSWQDENSPHTLVKFEFLAENKAQAEEYKESLIEHYNNNMPFRPTMPRTTTVLIETNINR